MIVIEIFKLFGSIFVDNKEADNSLSKTDEKAEGLFEKFSSGIKTVGAWGAALGGVAIAGGAALVGIANKASETASRVQDMSAKIGISKQGFQEWDHVLGLAGVNVEVLQGGFKKFSVAVDGAATGGKKQTEIFNELGISLKDVNGKTKSAETLFNESVTALQSMEAGTHKTALATQLFGKSSTEMGAILNGTAADLAKGKKEAHELGLVLSDEAIEAGDKFGDTMENVQNALGAIATKIGVAVMPTIQKMLDWIMAHMPEIQAKVEVAFNTAAVAVNMAISAIKSLTDFFTKHWNIIKPILVGIGAGALTFGLYTLAINAAAIATGIWTAVTGIATTIGTAFGVVMAFICSPIGLVVIAIGLLIAAGVLLYENWDVVKAKALEIWQSISDKLAPIIQGVKDAFGGLKTFVMDIWDGIVWGIKGYINLIISAVNIMIMGLNKLKFDVPNWVPGMGGKSWGISIPEIPKLAKGGNIGDGGAVMVGENGPEILSNIKGATVTPLDRSAGGININITGNTIMSDRDADKFGELIVNRLRMLGVT